MAAELKSRLRVLTPEQYAAGYWINPAVRLGAVRIAAECRPWPPAEYRTPEGNYVVVDPTEPDA